MRRLFLGLALMGMVLLQTTYYDVVSKTVTFHVEVTDTTDGTGAGHNESARDSSVHLAKRMRVGGFRPNLAVSVSLGIGALVAATVFALRAPGLKTGMAITLAAILAVSLALLLATTDIVVTKVAEDASFDDNGTISETVSVYGVGPSIWHGASQGSLGALGTLIALDVAILSSSIALLRPEVLLGDERARNLLRGGD